jgi:hypothetical protein
MPRKQQPERTVRLKIERRTTTTDEYTVEVTGDFAPQQTWTPRPRGERNKQTVKSLPKVRGR